MACQSDGLVRRRLGDNRMIDWYWILLLMVFCHIIEDFHIQGILAHLKQESWWFNQTGYNWKYSKDYIPPLLLHGLEWSVFIHIPLLFEYGLTMPIFISVIVNSLIHSYIDNLKCNRLKINLVQDQVFHIAQILITGIAITLYYSTIILVL